jgi:hypothetical protein
LAADFILMTSGCELTMEKVREAKMLEKEVTNPGSLVAAKALSLISLLVACFSGLHQIFELSIFEPEIIGLAFKASLFLMLIAMAFNGRAYQLSAKNPVLQVRDG